VPTLDAQYQFLKMENEYVPFMDSFPSESASTFSEIPLYHTDADSVYSAGRLEDLNTIRRLLESEVERRAFWKFLGFAILLSVLLLATFAAGVVIGYVL
jgi:hypothetical protein